MHPAAARSEPELLTRAADGDAAAVRELLDTVGPVVYGFVYARVGGNDGVAEDVVQETFLEAVRSASSFRGDSALSTWMCTIARRRLARHFESERREEVTRSGLSLVRPEEEEGAPSFENRDEVVQALGRLSPLHRQVLVLKYLDDRSVEDIARELGRTAVQVQSLLQRARDGLRRQLGGGR